MVFARIKIILLLLVLPIISTQSIYAKDLNIGDYDAKRISEILVGESGNNDQFQISLLACTVKNRLKDEKRFTVKTVMNEYYALPKRATHETMEIVKNILNGTLSFSLCNVYFAYSDADVKNLGIKEKPTARYNGINFFTKDQYARFWE